MASRACRDLSYIPAGGCMRTAMVFLHVVDLYLEEVLDGRCPKQNEYACCWVIICSIEKAVVFCHCRLVYLHCINLDLL